ncbi:fasciclin domain-containing protein [Pontibacter akesuensis]|uniref:Uncaracterized surface protein containing fasciclin (FAS1) repeats n=1 Tax=Pontibacter akesuensis TaxID=388950 RepID=A0A1I7K0N8_9BACT|nr:fasciclin domain-containing protein [Pontibacter akesuensis]GHA76009.1 hypothetical protein GCM10007389_32420 [Pontibacter akesuensis]SFU90997.1 Uncaracterized surface protein containing fasciclin (FAS1) repeats [Pontibacter akesuensis]
MKKKFITPFAAALLAAGIFGCASTTESMEDATAMEEDMSMSQTQTMAGSTSDVEEETSTSAAGTMAATADYSEMFLGIENTAQYDLIALASMDPNLSTFVSLVEQAGIAADLTAAEEYTVFAPTNAAFAALPQEDLEMMMRAENKAALIKLLQAHVLPTKVTSSGFSSSQRIETGGGEYVTIDVGPNNSSVTVGGATIVKSDVEAANGIIHVVDNVIQPTENMDRY